MSEMACFSVSVHLIAIIAVFAIYLAPPFFKVNTVYGLPLHLSIKIITLGENKLTGIGNCANIKTYKPLAMKGRVDVFRVR
jgi:hypothetical protein